MNNKRILTLLLVTPLIASCGSKKPLVIPTVDVDSLTISLPDKPTYNQGEIRSDDEFEYLDFYEVSDMHGAVNYEPGHSSGNYLGLAKMAGYFDAKRAENPGGTIILSSGDMFQGSAESNSTRGYMVNYCMNYMGFDSMTLGNHEFDWTAEWIEKNANLAYKDGHKIPYLGANVTQKLNGEIPSYLNKSTIIERGTHKIGIVGTIGYGLEKSILKSCVEDFEFASETAVVTSETEALRAQGCDIVVWSTHNGVDVAPSLTCINGVFGGHAHKNAALSKAGIPYVATKNYGQGIAHIELKISKADGTVSVGDYGVDETPDQLEGLVESSAVKSIMSQYDASISQIKDIYLGKCSENLIADVTLKNICVEAMRNAAVNAVKEAGLDIAEDKIIAAYHNVNGGVRADIEAGDITYGDVYKPFPFDNEVVLYKINGKRFKSVCVNDPFSTFAVCKNFKSRTELNNDEDYYIVLTDFIALSYVAEKVPEVTEAELIHTGKVVRDEVANYIYELEKIDASKFSSDLDKFSPVTRY